MTPARILTLILAVVLVAGGIIYGLSSGGGSGGSGDPTVPGAPQLDGDTVRVDFAYSPEKEQLLEPLLREFNRSGATVDGRSVQVVGQVVSSGASATQIAEGTLKPTLWSPASSLWGRLLNHRADADLAPDRNPSLVRSPLVIAMPEPMARALGWPDKSLGWADILAEARSDTGWAAHGHPEWGRFKFGQTNPDFSTSGLSATVAEYLMAAGKTEGLTLADVNRPKVRAAVADLQRSVVHYGDTTLFFAEQMAEKGPAYVSAVAMEEVTVLDYNQRLRQSGPKLVAIYPREGTFYSDNPLIALHGTWVDEAQRQGAEQLTAFLQERVDTATAARFSFRDAESTAPPPAPITAENGADPAQPTRLFSLPQPTVLNRILTAWREDRKPARVEVVLDISGSMLDEGKLDSARTGLIAFLRMLQPHDEVALSVFSSTVVPVSEPVTMREGRRSLEQRLNGLMAEGGTAAYDATLLAVRRIADKADDSRINAVVILSDGADNQSRTGLNELLRELRTRSGSEGGGVRVFTIAYGSDASTQEMAAIAEAGGGKAYTGDPATIEAVYIQIFELLLMRRHHRGIR